MGGFGDLFGGLADLFGEGVVEGVAHTTARLSRANPATRPSPKGARAIFAADRAC
jgi:hypothetical protein